MTMTVTQFNDTLLHPTVAGDTLYTIPYPTGYNFRTLDFIGWLRSLSTTPGGENFTAATFDGSQVLLVANQARFDAGVAGCTPAGVEVSLARSIAYSLTTFTEAVANDGSITLTSTLTLTNDTFTGSNGAPLAGAVVTHVPTGLTAVVTKASPTTATLSFTGRAAAHAASDSISNLTVTLGNAAFTAGWASTVTNATKANLVITFIDPA